MGGHGREGDRSHSCGGSSNGDAGAAEAVSPCGRQRAARRTFFVARAQRMRKASDGGIQPAWIAIP